MTAILQAAMRKHKNTSGLRRLRQSGRVPAIVFGKGTGNKMVHVSTVQMNKWIRNGLSGLIELKFEEGPTVKVLLDNTQYDPVTRELIHVDFLEVQQHEAVRTKIPIRIQGNAAGVKDGGIMQVQKSFIEVEALPNDVPSEIVIDVSELHIGDSLFVKDVELPANVAAVSDGYEFLLSVVKK